MTDNPRPELATLQSVMADLERIQREGIGVSALSEQLESLVPDADRWLTGREGNRYEPIIRRAAKHLERAVALADQIDNQLHEAQDLLTEVLDELRTDVS